MDMLLSVPEQCLLGDKIILHAVSRRNDLEVIRFFPAQEYYLSY